MQNHANQCVHSFYITFHEMSSHWNVVNASSASLRSGIQLIVFKRRGLRQQGLRVWLAPSHTALSAPGSLLLLLITTDINVLLNNHEWQENSDELSMLEQPRTWINNHICVYIGNDKYGCKYGRNAGSAKGRHLGNAKDQTLHLDMHWGRAKMLLLVLRAAKQRSQSVRIALESQNRQSKCHVNTCTILTYWTERVSS